MEKISDNKALLNSLGELITRKIEVISQEKKDHLSLEDDAVEHAKAYRMLGWNWDQIDTILEDMEFEPEIVKASIKRAQKYFEDTQTKGAFTMFMVGQLIKLKNGYVGKLMDKYPNKLQVKLLDGSDDLMVSEAQIDLDACVKLKEAFVLRSTANELIKTAKEEILTLDSHEETDGKLATLLACLFSRIDSSKKAIAEYKAPFKGNKKILSALGLEHASLETLEEELQTLDSNLAMIQDVPNFAGILTALSNTAEVLDQFKHERSILASHTVDGEGAKAYGLKVKQIKASVAKDVVPALAKISSELSTLTEELTSAKTANTVNAILKKVNKG